jgi:hypothetical protein
MAPPGSTEKQEEWTAVRTNADDHSSPMPRPPKFTDKLAERQYLKERLAAAFRIFAKNGFDEGVGMPPPGPRFPTSHVVNSPAKRVISPFAIQLSPIPSG